MQRDAFVAAVRTMVVGPRRHSGKDQILFPEDGFDQERRPSEPLAEGTMADRDAQRIRGDLIAHIAAQTAAFMTVRHRTPDFPGRGA
jgi:hypothetical protein